MSEPKKPALNVINGGKMYEDLPETEREDWEDEISAFVPAFVPVKIEETVYRHMDAHLVVGKDGKLAVRVMDQEEQVIFTFDFASLLTFDVEQYSEESWEQYFGLVEAFRQIFEATEEFKTRFQQVEALVKKRKDAPPEIKH